jgi:DeoR family fructose operon transcriptional repressor
VNKAKKTGDQLAQVRFLGILQTLKEQRSVTVTELSEKFQTSEATIRRDLNWLDQQGKLNKVHGGALALENVFETEEPNMTVKVSLNAEAKQKIGQYAAQLVVDDDFVFIDAGTTTWQLVESLKTTSASFVTNAVAHAQRLANQGLEVAVLGGQLKPVTEALIGTNALRNLQHYNFTKVFLGMNGISKAQGYTTPDLEEAAIKQTAIDLSQDAYILADHSKFAKVTAVKVADLGRACVITDALDDSSYLDQTIVHIASSAEFESKRNNQ